MSNMFLFFVFRPKCFSGIKHVLMIFIPKCVLTTMLSTNSITTYGHARFRDHTPSVNRPLDVVLCVVCIRDNVSIDGIANVRILNTFGFADA